MRHSSIELKSTKYVLTIVMDPDVPFETILEDVTDKFLKSARFFKGASMAMSFAGRSVTESEERQLLSAVNKSCDINITCIIEENEDRERAQYEAIARALPPTQEEDSEPEPDSEEISGEGESADILCGSLRNGQRVFSDKTILLLGDVEPGAEVASQKNVFIAGCAMGTVRAGIGSEEGCFAAALIMKPSALEVNGHRSVAAIRKRSFDDSYTPYPQICTVEDGRMKMDTISGRTWKHIFDRLSQKKEQAAQPESQSTE